MPSTSKIAALRIEPIARIELLHIRRKAEMLHVCDDDFSARGQRDNPRVLQTGKLAADRFKGKTKKIAISTRVNGSWKCAPSPSASPSLMFGMRVAIMSRKPATRS
jgi:hypothetical protein